VPVPAIRARCPRWLSPLAKKCWRFLFTRLVAVGRLRETDLPAMALACEAYGMAMMAAASLHEDGVLLKDGVHGGRKVNPSWRIFREASEAFRSYSQSFGLTPADRQRLTPLQPVEQGDFEKFLAARLVGTGKEGNDAGIEDS